MKYPNLNEVPSNYYIYKKNSTQQKCYLDYHKKETRARMVNEEQVIIVLNLYPERNLNRLFSLDKWALHTKVRP